MLSHSPAGTGRSSRTARAVPTDTQGKKVDLTMADVGARRLSEKAGFTRAADTTFGPERLPGVLMRRNLD